MDGFTFGALRTVNREIAVASEQLDQWRQYQQRMETALLEQTIETIVHATLKVRALDELRKFDPNNSLLDQAVRERIRDEVEREERARRSATTKDAG